MRGSAGSTPPASLVSKTPEGMANQAAQRSGPVFLVGTGRCGSTIVDSILSMHPQLAWMSSWVDTFPRFPALAIGNRIWGISALNRFLESRYFPTPVEPYDTFKKITQHFRSETMENEVVTEAREKIVPLIEKIRRYHGRPRYLAKLVGRPVKIELFAHLFPDARFVHVARKMKPTLSSLMKIHFYRDWGPIDDWYWDDIPEAYMDFYEREGRAEELGAAIRLYMNRRQLDLQLQRVEPSRWMELRYADFVEDPVCQIHAVCDFCQLPMDMAYEKSVRQRDVYPGTEDKWKNTFDEHQIARLDRFSEIVGWS